MSIEEYIKKIEQEFETTSNQHAELVEGIDAIEAAQLYSTTNLYDIEPFFSELEGGYVENPSFIYSEDDFDPNEDDLYRYKLNLEDKKVFFKQLILGENLSYDTFFSYEKEVIKSATIYVNQKERKAIQLCYLFLKQGMPDIFIKCTEYGAHAKKYKAQEHILLGFDLFF